jgi:alkylhydroperoxidase family enzyme
MNASLLDPGNLSLRYREIIIHRTTANCHSDYEFGVHAELFAQRAELKPADLRALAQPGLAANASQWSDSERVLVEACDQLHTTSTLDDACWRALDEHFEEEAIIEFLLLVGFYHTVSYLTNALRLPNEPFATSHLPGSREPR